MEAQPPTIFVSIASYRDPDLGNTVRSLFEQAVHPARLKLGICLQRSPVDDADCGVPADLLATYPEQIRIIEVHAAESRGACWARAKVQALYRGEDYYFQIDSHMRLVPGWDERLLAMLRLCPERRTVLSTYPLAFTPPDQFSAEQLVTMRPKGFDIHGVLTLNSTLSALEQAPAVPARSAFVSAGMLFGPAACMVEVPYDPYLYFEGEEIMLAVRLWTHGWDIRQPNQAVAFHNYGPQPERPRHWKDQGNWGEINRLARERIAYLLQQAGAGSAESLTDIARYSLGTARTLSDYQQFSGLDFTARLYQRAPAMAPVAAADVEPQLSARQRIFSDIWRRNLWGSAETRSGHGSTLAATTGLRAWLEQTWRFLGIRILADAGCGDLNWMQHLAPVLRLYLGFDIVPELVAELRQQHRKRNNMFFSELDLVSEVLPESDAILCRDCLSHLSLDAAMQVLEKFRQSGARYLFASTSLQADSSNRWLTTGYWHPVNLQAPPFNLPPPLLSYHEGGDKLLGVWSCEQLPSP